MDEKPKNREPSKVESKSTKKRVGSAAAKSSPAKKKAEPQKAAPEKAAGPPAGPKKLDAKTVRLGLAALLAVVAIAIGAIALLSDDSDDSSSKSKGSKSQSNAVALSESELISKVGDLGQAVYWIGPRAGTESYELSSTSDGSIYIRYLTGDAKAGEQSADFVTVGTYPVPEAQQSLEKATEKEGGAQKLSKHDGFEVVSSPGTTSAYVVFDDQPELQIEIFSPQQGEAAELATSGALEPVE